MNDVKCGFTPPVPGYLPCKRMKGHQGPCAHALNPFFIEGRMSSIESNLITRINEHAEELKRVGRFQRAITTLMICFIMFIMLLSLMLIFTNENILQPG